MKITLPEKVKVGAHTFQVLFPYKFRERIDATGQCDYLLGEIRISDMDACGVVRRDTTILLSFIHELLHACDYVSGHGVFYNNEPAIEGLSQAIAAVFVDNGWLPKTWEAEEAREDGEGA